MKGGATYITDSQPVINNLVEYLYYEHRPEISYSDDENRPGECDWCHDDRGICDRFIELDEDRRFSIQLEETFDVHMVRNRRLDICNIFS